MKWFRWLRSTLESIERQVKLTLETVEMMSRPRHPPERRAVVTLMLFATGPNGERVVDAATCVLSTRQTTLPSERIAINVQRPLKDLTLVVLCDPERVFVGGVFVGVNAQVLCGSPVAFAKAASPGVQVSAMVRFHDV